jgi:16S rRNA (uracil1498-N3)-methyltransferase
MRWFSVLSQLKSESILELSKDDYHYLSRVRRLKEGDPLSIVFDEVDCWSVKVDSFSKEGLHFTCLKKEAVDFRSSYRFHLAQGLPKQDKFSDIIDMCTQINVESFFPVITDRSVVEYTEKQKQSKVERWSRVAHSASLQSQRLKESLVTHVLSLEEFLSQDFSKYCLKLVAWEEEIVTGLRECIKDIPEQGDVLLFIGPEGGISAEEVSKLEKKGFKTITLGHTILRTEMAGFFTFSQLFSLLD